MNFEYKNYKLRKPKIDDAEGFYRISHDKEVMKYYGTIGAFCANINDAKRQVDWSIKQFAENAGRWIITEKSNGCYIGDIGFFNFVKEHNRVELGYRLCKKYRGKGIITSFIKQLLKWGFTELKYNRIEAMVDVKNEGSKIVLIRNQFQKEGILRDYEFEYGHYVDLEMYSILKRDYSK